MIVVRYLMLASDLMQCVPIHVHLHAHVHIHKYIYHTQTNLLELGIVQ